MRRSEWSRRSPVCFFFFSSRRRHTRSLRDWSSDVCSSDLALLRSQRLLVAGGHPTEGKLPLDSPPARLSNSSPPRFPSPARPIKVAQTVRQSRSEERRVGKEGRGRLAPAHYGRQEGLGYHR